MTPIERALNLAPVSTAKLRAVDITTLDELSAQGWATVWETLVLHFPDANNRNPGYALFAAEAGIDWRTLSQAQRTEVRRQQLRLSGNRKRRSSA